MPICDCCTRSASEAIGRGPDGRRSCAICEAYRRYVTGEYSEYIQALMEMELGAILTENAETPPSSSWAGASARSCR